MDFYEIPRGHKGFPDDTTERPKWLEPETMCDISDCDGDWGIWPVDTRADLWSWGDYNAFRIPADHWAVPDLKAGKWPVKNRAAEPSPAYPAELVERMVKLCRAVAMMPDTRQAGKARAILAELEMDPDPDLERARAIAAHTRRYGRKGAPYPSCGIAEKIEAGKWDDHMLVVAALEGIKRTKAAAS